VSAEKFSSNHVPNASPFSRRRRAYRIVREKANIVTKPAMLIKFTV